MFKITKLRICLAIGITALIGSFVVFYGTNLVIASVLNKDLPMSKLIVTFFPSLDFFFFSLNFVALLFFFLRLYLHPTHEQKLLKIYGSILMGFSVVGIVFNILSGTITYGSFLANHPFGGYHIVMFILHILVLASGALMVFFFPKKVINEDIIIHKVNIFHVLETAIMSVIFYLALNRLGAFFLSPMYIQWSTFSLTYPAYFALILPAVILVNDLVYIMGGYKKNPSFGIVISSFVVFLSVFFFGQIIVRGMTNQLFIQLISPINPIGRLLTYPYDTVLQMIAAFGLGIFTLFNSVVFKRKSDFNRLPLELRKAKSEGRLAVFTKKVTKKIRGEK